MSRRVSRSVTASFPSEKITIAAGVAIFHLATSRVVVCYHTREDYWFLPKGRRNVNETTIQAAEREGFEESGYRNRVLPLPMTHRQPAEDNVEIHGQEDGNQDHVARFVTEPFWTQFLPLSSTAQYVLFWYAAETVPPEVEAEMDRGCAKKGRYCPPRALEAELTLEQRVAMDVIAGDGDGQTVFCEPRRHDGTGVDEDEALYVSFLLPIEEARKRLDGSIMEDVVRRAWEAIQLRRKMEEPAKT